jgi:hypothetical protein
MKIFTKLLAVCAFAGWASAANAGIIALTATETGGNQDFNGTLGIEFTVNAGYTIEVTGLGVYDAGGDGFGGNSFYVAIFTAAQNLMIQVFGSPDTWTPTAGYNIFDFTSLVGPFSLSAGDYVLAAQGFDSTNNLWNAGFGGSAPSINDGGGAISFTGSTYNATTGSFLFPNVVDGIPTPRYHSATFEYDVVSAPAPVPAPATLALFGLGLAGLGWSRRKKA